MGVRIQRIIDFIFFVPICGPVVLIMKFFFRYRIEDHRELRRFFKEVTRDRRPLLICANHLTYIDSCVILWALAWHFWYVVHFRCFAWNLPAAEYKKNPLFAFIGYFAKCLFIDRKGSKQVHQRLEIAKRLLRRGDLVTIFPEGQRSRTGNFDPSRLTLGTGKIIADLGGCRVLCLYLRGDRQTTFSKFPARHSVFYLKAEMLDCRSELRGKLAHREIVAQIGAAIEKMERGYRARNGARSNR